MQKERQIERVAYSVAETAGAIGISQRTLWSRIKNGEIRVFKIGTRVLIAADELQRFIQTRTAVAGQDTPVIGSPEGVSR
jgi:excisionase family DNA binding protein